MRIVIDESGALRTFRVANRTASSTISELIQYAHLDERSWQHMWVDGQRVKPDTTLDEIPIVEGSTLSNQPPREGKSSAWQLVVVGGANTGLVHNLVDNQPVRIGRSPEADITIDSGSTSWSHCLVRAQDGHVQIVDDGSSNGTFVDGKKITEPGGVKVEQTAVLRIGGSNVEIRRTPPTIQSTSVGGKLTGAFTLPFNRPPRVALPPEPEAIELPTKKTENNPARFSWAAVIAPLLMAVALVAVMGSIRFAMIALLSPVMAVGSWWEQKRRSKTTTEENEKKFVEDIEKLKDDVEEAGIVERIRRRAKLPNPVVCMETARQGGANLWRARPSDDDFLTALGGIAPDKFDVPVDSSSNSRMEPEVREVLKDARIPASPVEVDLHSGPIGIWGERAAALALARSLVCQVATHSGPADLTIGVFTDKARANEWRWTAWLPHIRQGGANPNNLWLGLNTDLSSVLLRNLRDSTAGLLTAGLLLVIDNLALLEGRESPARDLLSWQPTREDRDSNRVITGIVIADHADQLPSSCRTVMQVKTDSELTITIPSEAASISGVVTAGVRADIAEDWARRLSKFDDPETKDRGASLPQMVPLLPLLGLQPGVTGAAISRIWRENKGFKAPLGAGENGTFWFDLVKDGPHGLVGGTTGSGKSELLRSMVAGLAAGVDPEHLNFILIDFKGGAAFATLDQLPHTIGTLTNLDAQLARRAIEALSAELLYRQKKFSEAGEAVDNLKAYWATNPPEPMPRLVVVIDEFAQLAKDYPDVLAALVSIGQVGRTLGVHMILATQRPAGVVNEDILANTNLRVALRVQSRDDSSSVINVPHAASIGRDQPGRAYIKLGEDDINPIQTALVTANTSGSAPESMYVDEITLGDPAPETPRMPRSEMSDLDELIVAIRDANTAQGFARPRPVWPEPLPEKVELLLPGRTRVDTQDAVSQGLKIRPKSGSIIYAGVSDDPPNQRQYPTGWDLNEGNLMVVGIPGSGTTTTLTTLALAIGSTYSPEQADFLYLDMGNYGLQPLQRLPHTIGYAGPGTVNRELQQRLLRYLKKQMELRMASREQHKKLFVFIDGFATLRDEYKEFDDLSLLETFYQVWAKGSDVGIHCVATTTRIKAIPSAIDDVTTQKWVFELADPYDYSLVGIKKDNTPHPIAGRCVFSETGHHTHIATPVSTIGEAVETVSQIWPEVEKTTVVATLPTHVRARDLMTRAQLLQEPRRIPIGIAEADLSEYVLNVYDGEHMLIAGPARSGKSTMLIALATKLREDAQADGQSLQIIGVSSRRSPLQSATDNFDEVVSIDDVSYIAATLIQPAVPTILMIDDADQIPDTDKALASLIESGVQNLTVIAAGRSDELRRLYSHWTTTLRKSRLGVLLQPNVDFDGELMGVTLPRRTPVKIGVGRGFACQGGAISIVQAITARGGDGE